MSGPYLTIEHAAQYLGLSSRSLRRRLDKIPHFRCDFGLRFAQEDLSVYMQNFRKEPTRAARLNLDDVLGPRRRERRAG